MDVECNATGELAELFESIGTPDFGSSFFRFASQQLNISHSTAFLFHSDEPPTVVWAEGGGWRSQVAREAANSYVQGPFSRDATLSVLKSGLATQHFAWRRVNRDAISDRDYRLQFFDGIEICEKFAAAAPTEAGTLYVNLYRAAGQSPFRESELLTLKRLSAVCVSAARKHLLLQDARGQRIRHDEQESASLTIRQPESKAKICRDSAGNRLNRDKTLAHLRAVLLAEAQMLSQREAEICAAIILGYTILGISLTYGITVNTVATHRKRAYRKLGVCSQNELFSRYFQAVNTQFARDTVPPEFHREDRQLNSRHAKYV